MATGTADGNGDERAIAATRAAFAAAVRRRDAGAAAEVYAHDARLLPPFADVMEGRPAIRAFWEAGLDSGVAEAALETVELERRDGVAFEVGRYRLRVELPDGRAVLERGNYVLVHERQDDGAWRWAVEMFNPDAPQGRGASHEQHDHEEERT